MASTKIQRMLRRTPRYALRPGDSKLIRFIVKGRQRREVVKTEITDISSTGLAFTTRAFQAPHVGEIIAMDFEIPKAHNQIAAYGRVVRIEHLHEDVDGHTEVVKVGVEFVQLPHQYQNLLEQKVTGAAQEAEVQETLRDFSEKAEHIAEKALKWGKYAFQITVVVLAIYGLARLILYAEEHQPQGGPVFGKKFSDWLDK